MRTVSRTSRQEFWRQVVARQCKSGLSIRGFCEQEGLATATFYLWKRRLGQPAVGQARGSLTPVGFAPVQVVPEAAPVAAAGSLEIFLSHDRRIRLTGMVDRQQLAEVLAAMA